MNKKIRDMSISIRRMKQQIKNTRDPIEKREINNRLEELQRSISSEIESREQAAQMRIKNFYKTGTGKMNPETFYCTVKGADNK